MECLIRKKSFSLVLFERVVEQLVLFLKGFKDAKPTKMLRDLGLEHFQAL